jgi:trans-aconitate 2-methyltransferase
MPANWDPALYLTFGEERTRPAADLLARVRLSAPKHVFDLGCGPGNSTSEARASGTFARWEQADFDVWAPSAPADLLFANSAIQWSKDPLTLTARLCHALAPGGVLALQVPQNFDQPSHVEVRVAVETGPWAEKLRGARQYDPGFARAADYARTLAPMGASLDIWTTEYLHMLDGPDAVFRWMSGTGLRPFTERLAGEERKAFEAAVRVRLGRAYPAEPDGRTLLPFRRLFVVATRS